MTLAVRSRSMPRRPPPPVHLRAARLLDVVTGELVTDAELTTDGERIAAVGPSEVPEGAIQLDLGDVTLLPGLMDMEVNLLMGGPDHESPLVAVQDDPVVK